MLLPTPTSTQSGKEILPTCRPSLDVLFRHSALLSLQLPSVPRETSYEVTQGRYKGQPGTPCRGDPFPLPTRPSHCRLLCTCLHPTRGQTGTSPGEGPCGQERRRKAASAHARRKDEASPPQPPFPPYGGCGRGVMTSPGPLASPNGRARLSRASEAASRWPLSQGVPRPRSRRPEGLPRLGGFRGALAPRTGLLWALRAPLVCPGVACLATRPCGDCPAACPAQSLSCQAPVASGLRPVPALPASPGPFPGVLLTRRAPG